MVEKTLVATVTVDANTPANMRKPVTLQEPGKTGVTEYVIPKGHKVIVKDAYIKASGDVTIDGIAIFVRNATEDVDKTSPLSTLLVSNPSRPKIPLIHYDEFEKMSVDFINTVAQGTSATSNTFYIVIDEIEKAKKVGDILAPLRTLF